MYVNVCEFPIMFNMLENITLMQVRRHGDVAALAKL